MGIKQMRRGILLCVLLGSSIGIGMAQERLQGLFEGTYTVGGINSAVMRKMEMYIRISGTRITGRSYIHEGRGKPTELELSGVLFNDFSVYLEETGMVPDGNSGVLVPIFRKYQLKYSGDFEEVWMKGFWQEVSDAPLDEKRRIGRVQLRKVRADKA